MQRADQTQSSSSLRATSYELRTYPRASRAGFTFIEVLLVLGITAILLVVGVLNTFNYVTRQKLETEARAAVAMLRDAQARAMGQDDESRWGVYFASESGSTRDYYVFFQADETLVASSSYTGVPGTALEQRTMESNITFVSPVAGSSSTILFSKVSGLPSASTTVSLQLIDNDASLKTIFISGNGKIDYQ